MIELTTKSAVLYVLKEKGISKYALAKSVGRNPIMVDFWIREKKPSRMSKPTADKFTEVYGIIITDIYNPIKEVDDESMGVSERTE